MKPSEHLRAALAYIERGWTKGAYARDTDGNDVSAYAPSARSWCALGAAVAGSQDDRNEELFHMYLKAARWSLQTVADINDSLPDQAAAIAWFKRAIELAESEGQ